MALHLIKVAVGCDSVAYLRGWQKRRLAKLRAEGQKRPRLQHVTRFAPKRAEEVLDGGSLYWIIRHQILCRQRILAIEPALDEEGEPACALVLDPKVVDVLPTPRRPHQGWRYFAAEDAPRDLDGRARGNADAMPPKLIAELRALGLL
ncbi:MAG: DUF1489 family protein [Alphaproteobacteria bacterium]